jgi:hypothetical protein
VIDDEDLMRALKREDPPEGFVERTLARAAAEASVTSRRPAWRSGPFLWMAAASMAACLAMVAGVAQFRSSHHEETGRRAAEELTLALRITSERLHEVQIKLTNQTRVSNGAQKDQ